MIYDLPKPGKAVHTNIWYCCVGQNGLLRVFNQTLD